MHSNSRFKKGAFFILVPALFVAISALFFVACQKSNDNNLNNGDDQGGYASDASRVEWANNDVISIADAVGTVYNGAYMRGGAKTTEIGTCCTAGSDTVSNLHQLVIRFGPNDCKCLDGRNRRGTIIVSYNGEYADTNQMHVITFDNYFVNGNQMTGYITTTRVDTTVAGNWYYKITVNDTMNVSQDPLNSKYVVWTGNLVRRWVNGYTTGDRGDDVFSISGRASLTRPNTHSFNFDIATPLQFALNCDYCESGTVNVSGYQGARILNYGAGNCDAAAQLNVGVHIYQLDLVK